MRIISISIYPSTKKPKILSFTTLLMKLEDFMLSEISQAQEELS
jgi:hypothetical protein